MTINLSRRKSVMSRSIKLGHCVCNPLQPCPCDTFREHNVCPCAGEKLPVQQGPVALTRHVRKAGCASKIGQADLLRILANLPPVTDPNVIVGAGAGDDAGVYRLAGGKALVQTVDVFTPCVDDAFLFGQIAAANSLSDVYAMGGAPLTALSIIGFPIDELDGAVMEAILRGGMEKLAEAGCALLGGHSINDDEIKFGFAVTGLIDPARVVERGRMRAGDALVLTKPLGTGMVSFGAQIGRVGADALNAVGAWMAALNRDAAELMVRLGAHACTDITGFGLAGHLVEMARTSGLAAELDLARLPVFAAARHCLENDILPGAIERNEEYSMAWVRAEEGAAGMPLLFDPQTSGGLLVALPPDRAEELVAELRRRGNEAAAVVGRAVEPAQLKLPGACPGMIAVRGGGIANVIGVFHPESDACAGRGQVSNVEVTTAEDVAMGDREGQSGGCCGSPPEGEGAPDAGALFAGFMKQANTPVLIDRRNKKLMAIALSVAQRCKPCLKIHIQSGQELGISRAEIDEAANLAIAFAGCPALMTYKEVWAELGGGKG
jgi:selenide,water dikinase